MVAADGAQALENPSYSLNTLRIGSIFWTLKRKLWFWLPLLLYSKNLKVISAVLLIASSLFLLFTYGQFRQIEKIGINIFFQ